MLRAVAHAAGAPVGGGVVAVGLPRGLDRIAVSFDVGTGAGELGAGAERRPFPIPLGTDGEEGRLRIGHHHPDQAVAGGELDPPDPARVAPHRPGIGFREADRHSLGRGEHELVARPGDHRIDELIPVAELDRDQALCPPPLVLLERGLLHDAAARDEHQVLVRIVEAGHGPAVGDLLPLFELEKIDQRPPLGVPRQFGELEDAEREHLAERREDEEEIVGTGHEEVLDRILLVGAGAGEPLPAAALGPVGVGGRPLHIPGPTDRHDHRRFGDQLRHVADVAGLAADLRPTLVAMPVGELEELCPDHPPDVGFAGEEPTELADLAEQFRVFGRQFLLLEVHKLPEREAEDRVGLDGREAVGLRHPPFLLEDGEALGTEGPLEQGGRRLDLRQALLCLRLRAGAADDLDHLVDVRKRHQQPLEGVLAAAGLLEEVLCAAPEDRRAVTEEFLEEVLEGEDPRLAIDQRQEDQREARLQGGELVELVEDDVGVGIALQLQHQPHRLLEIALVADRRDPLDPILVDQFGDLLLDRVAGLLIGNLRDDDPGAVLAELLDLGPGTERDRAPTGGVAAEERLPSHDDAAGGEIRPGNDLEQFAERHRGVVDEGDQRPADLTEIVGGDAGRHADGDAAGPVDDEVGEAPRQHHRLGVPFVVGGDVIDRVELQIVEHHRRDRRESRFGVPHRGGREAGDRAEVPLLVDEDMPHVPFLGHADEGWVDDALAVGVVVAAGVAGDLGAFDPGSPRRKVEIVHRHEDAALRGLEPVADVGEGPRDDDAHRVGEVAVLQLLLDRLLDQPATGIIPQGPVGTDGIPATRVPPPLLPAAGLLPAGGQFVLRSPLLRLFVCQRPHSQLGRRRRTAGKA